MRILYHHRTMGDGAEGVHIREMVGALRQLGHEVLVVSIVGEPTRKPSATANRWQSFRRRIPSWCYELAELGYNLVDVQRLKRAAKAFRPDFVYDRYNSYSTAALSASRYYGCPLILEVNAPVVFERTNYEFMRLKFPRLAEWYERKIFAGADHVLTVSTALKAYLIRERAVSASKISVIPNAINPDYFARSPARSSIRDKYGLTACTVVGFVGSLRAWHGLDLLIKVIPNILALHSDCHFLIVGAGEQESKFREFVQKTALEARITMTGWVPHEEVPAYIEAMDITLMPHSNFYGSPIKIFEYMALGKAVVAPALGPLQEVIADGQSGVLFAPGNSEALLESILTLLNDPVKRKAIGARGKEVVFERHTWVRNAEEVTRIATSLVESSS